MTWFSMQEITLLLFKKEHEPLCVVESNIITNYLYFVFYMALPRYHTSYLLPYVLVAFKKHKCLYALRIMPTHWSDTADDVMAYTSMILTSWPLNNSDHAFDFSHLGDARKRHHTARYVLTCTTPFWANIMMTRFNVGHIPVCIPSRYTKPHDNQVQGIVVSGGR